MEDFQFAGLAIILLGAIPCFKLARYIEKQKHWSLFSGLDPAKIADEDAYGKQLCKGLKGFSVVFGLAGVVILLNLAAGEFFILAAVVLPALPMFYYLIKAKSLYGKKSPDE